MMVDANDDYEIIDEKGLDAQDVAIITPADSPEDAAIDAPTPVGAQEEEEDVPAMADEPMAMMAQHMPAIPDLDVECEESYTFTIEDWAKLGKREHGPSFEVGGAPW